MALIDKLTNIANAIRSKTGKTDAMTLDQMATEIEGISGGGDEVLIGLIEGIAMGFDIPNGTTVIRDCAFYQHKNIVITSLPNGITSVGKNAFDGCSSITINYLPDSLKVVTDYAFRGCANITSVSFPADVQTKSYSFMGCSNLTEVTFRGKPNLLSSMTFNNCANLITINVPWAEDEVPYAPWGATNATINYNYTGE